MKFRILATVLVLALAACSDKEETTSSSSGSSGKAGACASDNRKDTYSAGLTKQSVGAAVSVKIMDATPAPPTKGTNVMT